MAIESINVGNIANDGTGDDLREAFVKVNNNLIAVDNRITTLREIKGENLGTAGEGIFAGKNIDTLQFKEIVPGNNTTITSNSTSVIIESTGGLTGFDVLADNGHVTVDSSNNDLIIQGGALIETKAPGNALFINLKDSGIVAYDTDPTLSSTLKANGNNIADVNSVNANSFNGPLTGLVYGVDIREINQYFDNNWDFGGIFPEYSNTIEYIIGQTDIDMGAFVGQGVADFNIDLGFIV